MFEGPVFDFKVKLCYEIGCCDDRIGSKWRYFMSSALFAPNLGKLIKDKVIIPYDNYEKCMPQLFRYTLRTTNKIKDGLVRNGIVMEILRKDRKYLVIDFSKLKFYRRKNEPPFEDSYMVKHLTSN